MYSYIIVGHDNRVGQFIRVTNDDTHYAELSIIFHQKWSKANLMTVRITSFISQSSYLTSSSVDKSTLHYMCFFVTIGSVDIWCLGVLTFEFLCGFPPFEAQDHHSTYKKISKIDIHFPDHVSDKARDLIMKVCNITINIVIASVFIS